MRHDTHGNPKYCWSEAVQLRILSLRAIFALRWYSMRLVSDLHVLLWIDFRCQDTIGYMHSESGMRHFRTEQIATAAPAHGLHPIAPYAFLRP